MPYGTVKVDTIVTSTQSVSVDGLAPKVSPALTGTPTAPTASAATNSTQIATTAFVKAQGYATLASPAFTGTPTAPTQAVDNNTTRVATTAYVVGQGYLKSASAASTYAPISSPAFTGDIELSAQAPVRFMDANSSNWVALRAPATVSANVTWTLPNADGSSGTVLTTDGSGNLSWAAGGASLGLAVALG